METGMAFIQDLLEISSNAPKGIKEKPGNMLENLLNDLASGEENFLSTLLDLSEDKNFQDPVSPDHLDTLMPAMVDKGTRLQTLVDLVMLKLDESTLGKEKEAIKSDLVVQKGASIIEGLNADVIQQDRVVQSNETQKERNNIKDNPENSGIALKQSKAIEVTKESEATANNFEKLTQLNAKLIKDDIVSSNTPSLLDLNSVRIRGRGEIKSGSVIQGDSLQHKVTETDSPKLTEIIRINDLSHKDNHVDAIDNKSVLASEFDTKKSHETGVKSGADTNKGLNNLKVSDSDSVNMAKVLQYVGQENQADKLISEEEGIPKFASDIKNYSQDPAGPEKFIMASGQKAEKLKFAPVINDKENSSRSESEPQSGEEGLSKTGSEASRISALKKNIEADSPNISRNPQVTQTANVNVKTPGIEKAVLQEDVSLNPETGDKDRFPENINKGANILNINPDSGQKYLNIRPETSKTDALDPNMTENKLVKPDSGGEENTSSSTNTHTSDKSFESILQTRETHSVQKPVQNDIMSQLVEKAVLSLKNGQTSMRIRLKPEVLGHLRMRISTENNHVMVRIVTEIPLVKEIIESNISQLRAELQNHGLEMEKFDVSVDQGENQNQGAPKKLPFRRMVDKTDDGESAEGIRRITNNAISTDKKGNGETAIDFFA